MSLFGRARVESFLFLSSSLPLFLSSSLPLFLSSSLIAFLPFPFLSSSSPLFLSPSFPVPFLLDSSLPYTNGSKHNSILCNGGQPHRKKKRRNCFFFCKGKRRSFDVVSCKSLRATDAPSCPRKAMGVVWLCTTTKPLPVHLLSYGCVCQIAIQLGKTFRGTLFSDNPIF